MRTIFRQLTVVAVYLPAAMGTAALAQPSASSPWHEDLVFLRAKLETMDPDPFRKIGRTRFALEADRLDKEFAGASREQAIVGMMRLVAMLGDGHTTVLPGPQLRAGFHALPLRFYLYGDDLVLDGADRAYADALGGKLEAINGVPAREVIRRLREVTPGDNSSTVNARLPSYIVVPEILAGLGIIPSPASAVSVTINNNGTMRSFAVNPVPPAKNPMVPPMSAVYSATWVDRAPTVRPLWLQHTDKPYWFTYLPKSHALYVQYNSASSDAVEPMPRFTDRLTRVIVERRPSRIIVDLRLNPGGNGYWNRPLVRALLRSETAGKKGAFFVLTGRQTFSAGNMMAIELEKYAVVTFVGEASGGSVQGFGDHEPVFLPNSGIGVMIATKFYQNDGPSDDRPTITPQIPVQMTADDYGAGRDPVLEAALNAGL